MQQSRPGGFWGGNMVQGMPGRRAAMRRGIRIVGLCLVASLVLGLSACDVGPAVLQGTLTHADTGEPLADVAVRVYSSTEESVVARGRTGEDGTYRFRSGALPAGTYRVVFSGDHWWENGTSWDTATDVTVSTSQTTQLDTGLVPPTSILWGRTGFSPSDEFPLPVEVFHADTGELVATATSEDWSIGDPIEGIPCSGLGSTGCYQAELPAGDLYWVRVGGTDFGTADNTANGAFEIELGVDDRQADVYVNSRSAFVGRVVDPSGVPVPGARVIAIPAARVPPILPEGTTGADGRWGVSVAAGTYRLGIIGSDGTMTVVGVVNGDPATATQFSVDPLSTVIVGDITLGGP